MILAGADDSRIDILHHLVDSPTVFGLDLSSVGITKHVVFMWIASGALIVVMNIAARSRGLVPSGLRNLVEPILIYLRDEVAVPNLGDKANQYLPYLWTVFFFVLFCNLLGLVPGGATATGNLSVTAGLALISMFCIHFVGIREQGIVHYLGSIVPPVPLWLWPILLVVEIVGMLAKPFALAIRLWANMTGGHIIILVLMGFIFLFKTWLVVPVSVVGSAAIYLLELFVAVLQAYVFTFLTAVFMGMAVHPAH